MFAGKKKNNSKILSAGALFLVKIASWEKMLLTRTEWHWETVFFHEYSSLTVWGGNKNIFKKKKQCSLSPPEGMLSLLNPTFPL